MSQDGWELVTIEHEDYAWAFGFMRIDGPVHPGELILFGAAFPGDKDIYEDVFLSIARSHFRNRIS
ncbi:MAG: hypothetical protein QM451_03260 [Bacillota bacterium]|jgi:hypothetical protein|nr:hypothetical protein [Bacillota bacterium]MDR9756169.1 hypothetical protein [Thermoanaerobacterales bacterium]